MSKYDLAIIIPSRNEEFLRETIEDIFRQSEARTEVIAVLDGQWSVTPLPMDERLTVIYHPESVGQRAATNDAVKVSDAKYVMKLDAHCALDKGFDRKMIEAFKEVGDDVTMVPAMKNLWVFDWECQDCGKRTYQDTEHEVCEKCGSTNIKKKILWIAKKSPHNRSYCFDSEPHFQYFREFNKRPEGKGDLTESMSLQGSCFMCTKEKYLELNLCDEGFGSWGSQGIEVACKTWLSGGRVMCNNRTWYAHLFRTKNKVFGFPYHNPGRRQQKAKALVRDMFFNNAWPQAIKPLSWLVEKFYPVKGWTDEDIDELKKRETPRE